MVVSVTDAGNANDFSRWPRCFTRTKCGTIPDALIAAYYPQNWAGEYGRAPNFVGNEQVLGVSVGFDMESASLR